MKPVILFIPYFGNVPPYISAFLHTIGFQKEFLDVCFVVDTQFKHELLAFDIPENVKFFVIEWDDFCEYIATDKHLVKPFSPYKLCDYKPAYGYIFDSYTKDYEYWGYCDIDVLIGDVQGFLEGCDYQKYGRIGKYGHFTIYKNDPEVKMFFNKKGTKQHYFNVFENVVKTTYPCNFDEIGSNELFIEIFGAKWFLQENFVFDTAIGCTGCHTYSNRDVPQLLTWENGHTFSYTLNNSVIDRNECMYIHFMLHKKVQSPLNMQNSIVLSPTRILNFDKDNIQEYFETIGKVDNALERNNSLRDYRDKVREQRKNRFLNEVKNVGLLRALKHVMMRSNAIGQLISHGIL